MSRALDTGESMARSGFTTPLELTSWMGSVIGRSVRAKRHITLVIQQVYAYSSFYLHPTRHSPTRAPTRAIDLCSSIALRPKNQNGGQRDGADVPAGAD